MTDHKITTEIVIIGGGLVGLTMAISLAAENVSVILIDKNSEHDFLDQKFDARASAISYGSKEFLEKYNLWDEIEEYAGKINDILVKDRDSLLSLEFNKNIISANPMGYIVNNKAIYAALFKAARQYNNLKILLSTEYKNINFLDDSVKVLLADQRQITAKLLIASDGKRSNIRKLLSIKTIDRDYHQDAIICNIKHQNHHNEIAIERFFPAGPFAMLPMVGGYQSAIVWTAKRDKVKNFLSLDKVAFEKELAKRCDESLGEISLVSDRVSYPLKLTLARKYTAHRVAFIGDSIHGMHPLAGQGYNLAVRDISSLLIEIINAGYMKYDIGSKEILSAYQKSRYVDSISMAGMTHGLNALFSNDIMPLKLLRRLGLSLVDNLPFIKKKIVKHAMFGIR